MTYSWRQANKKKQKSWFSGFLCRVVCWLGANVSEDRNTEDGGSKILRNVGMLQPGKPQILFSPLRKPQISQQGNIAFRKFVWRGGCYIIINTRVLWFLAGNSSFWDKWSCSWNLAAFSVFLWISFYTGTNHVHKDTENHAHVKTLQADKCKTL